LKAYKAAGCVKIRPKMLKALNQEEDLWLTRGCQVAWRTGQGCGTASQAISDDSSWSRSQKRLDGGAKPEPEIFIPVPQP